MLTASEDAAEMRECLAAGAAGFLPKAALASELLPAIHSLAAGGHYVHPSVMEKLIKAEFPSRAPDATTISERQTDVLRLIARGFSNKEIAAQLSLSVKTIETYKARGMERANLSSRVDLVAYAAAQGWLDSPRSQRDR